jgi:hypothetical protein
MKLRKILNIFWDDVSKGENIDVYVSIIVAFISSILSFFNIISASILNGIFLAILCVIVISSLVSRHKLSLIETENQQVINYIKNIGVNSSDFFKSRKVLSVLQNIKGTTKSLDLLGQSLNGFSLQYKAELINLKKSGVKIRLLVTNPDNEALQKMISLRCLETSDEKSHKKIVQLAIDNFLSIIGIEPNGGSIELRVTDFPPHFSYLGMDNSTENGTIQIEMYLDHNALADNPIFILKKNIDKIWYSSFHDQYEFLWDNATKIMGNR